jgi:hypothetical protein
VVATWQFDAATLERTAAASTTRLRRHRHPQLSPPAGLAAGDPRYADLQRRLAALPAITVPAITLDGDADGVAPSTASV